MGKVVNIYLADETIEILERVQKELQTVSIDALINLAIEEKYKSNIQAISKEIEEIIQMNYEDAIDSIISLLRRETSPN